MIGEIKKKGAKIEVKGNLGRDCPVEFALKPDATNKGVLKRRRRKRT
jgi:hypothetical protein